MYGAQAQESFCTDEWVFENDVEMYGAQANPHLVRVPHLFENDVEMYGAQAPRLKRYAY